MKGRLVLLAWVMGHYFAFSFQFENFVVFHSSSTIHNCNFRVVFGFGIYSAGWSGQSSMTGSFSAMSSGGPSSPENSISRSEVSASIISDER